MSSHMHLRAVPESEVRDDWSWLEEFMGAAWDWDVRQTEHAAGIATSVEKDFGALHELYGAAADLPEGSGGAWELPVYGPGRVVYHPSDTYPPFVLLAPAETRSTAAFLTGVSFDDLWESSAGAKIRASFAGWDEAEVKGIYLSHHRTCALSTDVPPRTVGPSSRPSGTRRSGSPWPERRSCPWPARARGRGDRLLPGGRPGPGPVGPRQARTGLRAAGRTAVHVSARPPGA